MWGDIRRIGIIRFFTQGSGRVEANWAAPIQLLTVAGGNGNRRGAVTFSSPRGARGAGFRLGADYDYQHRYKAVLGLGGSVRGRTFFLGGREDAGLLLPTGGVGLRDPNEGGGTGAGPWVQGGPN